MVALDWSKLNPDHICFLSTDGTLMSWHVTFNSCQAYNFGKLSATCLALSPHSNDIAAIGTKKGLIMLVELSRNGTVIYKLRGHDVEITSLSWCPRDPNDSFDNKQKEHYLASGAKDRSIYYSC